MGKSCQLTEVEREKLQQWTAAHGTPQQVALRCRIVLGAAAGESDVTIAKRACGESKHSDSVAQALW
jgi:hypothetical protein